MSLRLCVRWIVSLGLFFCSAQVWAKPSAPAPGSREWVKQQARQVHRRGRYPSELPQHRMKAPQKGLMQRLLERLFGDDERQRRRYNADRYKGASSVVRLIFYGLLCVLLGLLVLFLARFVRESYSAGRTKAESAETGTVEMFGMKLPLDMSPEELLQQGKLDMALCVLLLRGMREVGWRDDQQGRSQTAREVVWKVPSHDLRQAPLRRLLAMVERVRFGGVVATHEMVSEGQEAYQQIVTTSAHAKVTPHQVKVTTREVR